MKVWYAAWTDEHPVHGFRPIVSLFKNEIDAQRCAAKYTVDFVEEMAKSDVGRTMLKCSGWDNNRLQEFKKAFEDEDFDFVFDEGGIFAITYVMSEEIDA